MQEEPSSSHVKDELLVGFFARVGHEKRDEIHEAMGSKLLLRYALIPADHVRLAEGFTVEQAIEGYEAYTNDVDYAEPVYVVRTQGVKREGREER